MMFDKITEFEDLTGCHAYSLEGIDNLAEALEIFGRIESATNLRAWKEYMTKHIEQEFQDEITANRQA